MEALYLAALALIAALSVLGVLSPVFRDNTLQRVGLALVCLGASAELWLSVQPLAAVAHRARELLAIGTALYGLGTLIKILKYWRAER